MTFQSSAKITNLDNVTKSSIFRKKPESSLMAFGLLNTRKRNALFFIVTFRTQSMSSKSKKKEKK